MKRYANTAVVYAVIAMVCGVFYREFTKFNGFEGRTVLSALHPHYFMLGMAFFLLLLLLEKAVGFSGAGAGKVLAVYHVGLNLTGLTLLLRGVTQVLGRTCPLPWTAPCPAWPASAISCWGSACFCCSSGFGNACPPASKQPLMGAARAHTVRPGGSLSGVPAHKDVPGGNRIPTRKKNGG